MEYVNVTIPLNTGAIANQDEDRLDVEIRLGQHNAALMAGLQASIAAGAFQVEIVQPVDVPLRTAPFGEGTRS